MLPPLVAPPTGPELRRSTRAKNPSTLLKAAQETEANIQDAVGADRAWAKDSIKAKAVTRPDLWAAPVTDKSDKLHIRKVWHLVKKPANANIMKTRWVFAIKYDTDGDVKSHKA